MGETVRKVKYSSVRIENPLLARGTEYFSLARTFRTVWRMDRELIGYNEEDCLTRNP